MAYCLLGLKYVILNVLQSYPLGNALLCCAGTPTLGTRFFLSGYNSAFNFYRLGTMRVLQIMSFCLAMGLSFHTHATAAPWLVPFTQPADEGWPATELDVQSDLFDCSLEEEFEHFCSTQARYYETPVEAEIKVTDGTANKMVLTSKYEVAHANNLQLALRRDGFQIAHIFVAEHHLNVAQALKLSDDVEQVNRDAYFLLNNYRFANQPKTIKWQKLAILNGVEYRSDVTYQANDNVITLEFVRSQTQ